MAYMSQENKKSKAPAIKAVLNKYNIKGSIGVKHHSTLVVNLKSGKIDFINSVNKDRGPNNEFHYQVNEYYIEEHWTGQALKFLTELKAAMMTGNHNRSDIQTDYFDVGWYIDINIGQWDKPFIVA